MRVVKQIIIVLAALSLGLLSVPSFAGSGNAKPRTFGIGFPGKVEDLPQSDFKAYLQSLPPQARGKALQTLRKFQFTELDLPFIKADPEGGVYFADVFPQKAGPDSAELTVPVAEAIPESEIFLLHSRPGSTNKIFLDFDGENISGTAWNSGAAATYYAKPYDPSGNDTITQACSLPGTPPLYTVNYSSAELADIGEIWHRIAEDYAPFDVDVTTEEPATFDRYTGHILFTQDVDLCGQNMPSCCSAGGVAYVGVFGASNYHTYYSPALIYFNKLGSLTSRPEAASHEMGHNLSLGHDGTSTESYYLGHGSADTSPVDLNSWAPIMGAGYYRNVTQWSQGDYPDAVLYGQGGNYQATTDDLLAIAGYLGYRADDHGDSIATAAALSVQGDGTIAVTNPETDPHNFSPENKGVIGNRNDVDYFYFDTGAGAVSITIEPAWAAFYRTATRRGANLDIMATLYDSTGTIVTSDEPTDDTDAHLSATVAAGRYYVAIDGVGNAGNTNDPANENYGYDDYASIGEYFISGAVQPTSADTTPPAPDPMTWASVPAATGSSSMTMTATTATDDSGFVEYYFNCTAGGAGCVPSGWQTGTSHTATGLDPNTSYTWQVRARDSSNNLTAYSSSASDTTDDVAPNAPGNPAATAVSQTQIDVSWTDNSDNETGFEIDHSTDGVSYSLLTTTAANATGYSHTSLGVNTTHYYKIRATNAIGDSADAGPVSATTWDTPPAAPDGLGATANGASQIDLAWTDNSVNETGFAIERSPDGTGSWAALDTVGADTTSYSDTGLSPLSTWYYRVKGTNSGGSSDWSNTASATTTDAPPTGPSALSATTVSAGQIELAWTDNSSNETGFGIERSATGNNPWVQIDSVAADVTGYQDSGLSELTTYYYRVNATGAGGDSAYSNTANATTFEGCSASKTYNAGQWYQFSLACNPAPNNTVAEIFSGHNVEVYRADAQNEVYIAVGPGEVMEPGVGYFIIFDAQTNFTLDGYKNTATDIPLVTDAVTGKQNLVGVYGNGTVAWPDVEVVDGSQVKTIAEADPVSNKPQDGGAHVCDLASPTNKCLVSRKLNMWTGSQYEVYDGETTGMIGTINALDGLWVKGFASGVQLRIPTPAPGAPTASGQDGSLATNPGDDHRAAGQGQGKENEPAARFIRLIAESGNSADKGNVFGQHPGSVDGLDTHDLEEPPPFGGKWLSILFTNPLFDAVDWGYTSDYRAPADTFSGNWPFVVKSSANFSEITLRWRGREELFQNAWLIDEQTGSIIKVKADDSYTFKPQDDGVSHFTFVFE